MTLCEQSSSVKMIFENLNNVCCANAATILLLNSVFTKDMIQSGKIKNSSPVSKEFLRLANEFYTNDSKKKLSVVPLVEAVSKAGSENFKLEEHHCPTQFLNQLMDSIAKEHKQQPENFSPNKREWQ